MYKVIHLENGKYKIIVPESPDVKFECFRYDEPWRDLSGDTLVLTLCQQLLKCEELLARQNNKV